MDKTSLGLKKYLQHQGLQSLKGSYTFAAPYLIKYG